MDGLNFDVSIDGCSHKSKSQRLHLNLPRDRMAEGDGEEGETIGNPEISRLLGPSNMDIETARAPNDPDNLDDQELLISPANQAFILGAASSSSGSEDGHCLSRNKANTSNNRYSNNNADE